jgi:SAM-dependent methyltransferase
MQHSKYKFIMKINHESKVSTVFNSWAGQERGERMAKGHDALLLPLLNIWDFSKVTRILDLGCGNGRALQFALSHGAQAVAGVDIAEKMITEAKNNIPEGDFLVTPMYDLPWPDAHFSHILSVEAIYYLTDPVAAFKEMRRVLAPDGRIAILLEFFQENEAAHIWAENLGLDMTLWSSAQWVEAMEAAGFNGIKASRIIREAIKPESEFQPSPSFPSYEMYLDYVNAGALMLSN